MSVTQPPLNAPEIRRLDPVLEPGHTYASVTDKIAAVVLTRPLGIGWLAGFTLTFSLVMLLFGSLAWLIVKGVGIWGINIPIGWGFAIVNFVWWIGIGHAGTLISAILFLLNQKWRTSINRFAEAMTLFAVACAGHLPADPHWPPLDGLLHVPVSQHHGHLAAVPQPAHLGRLRGFHLRHGFADVLVYWFAARPGHAAGPRKEPLPATDLRHAGDGLAWFGAPLASLPVGLSRC